MVETSGFVREIFLLSDNCRKQRRVRVRRIRLHNDIASTRDKMIIFLVDNMRKVASRVLPDSRRRSKSFLLDSVLYPFVDCSSYHGRVSQSSFQLTWMEDLSDVEVLLKNVPLCEPEFSNSKQKNRDALFSETRNSERLSFSVVHDVSLTGRLDGNIHTLKYGIIIVRKAMKFSLSNSKLTKDQIVYF